MQFVSFGFLLLLPVAAIVNFIIPRKFRYIWLLVISAAFYINARMGLSPYDGLATIIGEKLRKIPPVITRMAYDFTFLLVGVLASIGSGIDISTSLIGSIAMSLSLGPAIQLVGKLVNKKILKTEGQTKD